MELLDRAASTLVLVDYQERLMPAIRHGDAVVGAAARLLGFARLLEVPVVLTRQYPKGLGDVVEPLRAASAIVVDKTRFSAADVVAENLGKGRPDVVIAGCEAHICLLQTAMELVQAGRHVAVVADASGSRATVSKKWAMRRLAQAGAQVVTSEMVAFEWLRDATDPAFKAVSALIR